MNSCFFRSKQNDDTAPLLPSEMWIYILSFLNCPSLKKSLLVNKAWNQLIHILCRQRILSALTQYDLVSILPSPQYNTLADIPVDSCKALIRYKGELYYRDVIQDRVIIFSLNEETLKEFDEVLQPRLQARTLSTSELTKIAEMTGYDIREHQNDKILEKIKEFIEVYPGKTAFVATQLDYFKHQNRLFCQEKAVQKKVVESIKNHFGIFAGIDIFFIIFFGIMSLEFSKVKGYSFFQAVNELILQPLCTEDENKNKECGPFNPLLAFFLLINLAFSLLFYWDRKDFTESARKYYKEKGYNPCQDFIDQIKKPEKSFCHLM